MKIYISAPVKNRNELKPFFNALDEVTKKGHKIIDIYKEDDLLVSEDVDKLVEKYKQIERAIRESDVVIVESTFPGRRIGFEIARAIDEKKSVIALYDKSLAKRTPGLLVGVQARKHFTYAAYSADTVKSVIESALEEAKMNLDTKFILIISPEIDKYLEWSSSERRMHKAQIVRNAVESAMSKDKEYKEFLKGIDAE